MNQDWVFQPLWEKFGPNDPVFARCAKDNATEWDWEKLLEDYAPKILRCRSLSDCHDQIADFKNLEVLIALSEDSFLTIRQGVIEVFSPSSDRTRQLLEDIERRYFEVNDGRSFPGFYFVHSQESRSGQYHINVDHMRIKQAAYLKDAKELPYYYGDEMEAFDRQLKDNMKTLPTGIAFLHGDPGTGKTSYLRHLIHNMSESHDFYMISIPEFWGFLYGQWYRFWRERIKSTRGRRVVLIVEDAETHIERQNEHTFWRRSPVMSEFLQIADGLLGDALHLQIIVTTNLNLSNIDPALTRKGRLLGYRAFRALTPLEAHRLYRRLGKELPSKQERWTLAELMTAESSPEAPRKKKSLIGFTQQDMKL
ncbi:MAG: AAA family ATPase [Opitutales bacterium]|nr:AAA family ATPase [Opitutales bacterium]